MARPPRCVVRYVRTGATTCYPKTGSGAEIVAALAKKNMVTESLPCEGFAQHVEEPVGLVQISPHHKNMANSS